VYLINDNAVDLFMSWPVKLQC